MTYPTDSYPDIPLPVLGDVGPVAGRFERDKFLLNQKAFSMGGKYTIFDEAGLPLFYVDRPLFKFRSHIGVYADEARTRKALTLYQDSPFAVINLSFTVLDDNEQPIGALKRQGWMSLLRRTWKVFDPAGNELAHAQEDALWKAILRRLPYLRIIGVMFRTNFLLFGPDGGRLGEYIRRYTVLDKQIMDVTADTSRALDRRIVVALSIVLDNAERH